MASGATNEYYGSLPWPYRPVDPLLTSQIEVWWLQLLLRSYGVHNDRYPHGVSKGVYAIGEAALGNRAQALENGRQNQYFNVNDFIFCAQRILSYWEMKNKIQ